MLTRQLKSALNTSKARKNVRVRYSYGFGHGRRSDYETWTESVDEDAPAQLRTAEQCAKYNGRCVKRRMDI